MSALKPTDSEIVKFFEENQGELSQERNDFLLPQITDFVRQKKWLNIRPEYQRRAVWDKKKKSRLIESLLMNVPVPPIYLYEKDYSRYEVMDGQQRLNAIIEFYANRFKLSTLDSWKIMNGKTYEDLPVKVQRGLDRRRISATVIISDLTDRQYGPEDVRRQVFERLNTGGLQLNAQELRNCLFPGIFNQLLIELAGHETFTNVFNIPSHKTNITYGGRVSSALAEDTIYKRMTDCELVLRFFTFRRPKGLRGSIPKALDNCMVDYQDTTPAEAEELREVFLTRLEVAIAIFGDDTFYLTGQTKRTKRPSIPLYDATMIAIDQLYENRNLLIENSDIIRGVLTDLQKDKDNFETITGKPGTAKAIKARIELIRDEYASAAGI